MQISKLNIYIALSFAALFGVGYKVIAPHDGNFYRSIVALTISRWFNLALCNAGLAFLLSCFWISIRIFFEKLHPLESSYLQEKFLVFAAESVLGVAMVRGTVTVTDGVMFLITCAVTMVHAVLVKRMNMLEESAMTTTKRRIVSVSFLTGWLFIIDASVCLWLASMVWGSSSSDPASSISGKAYTQTNNGGSALFGRSAGVVLLLLLEWCLNIMQCITATTKLALLAFAARFPSEVTNSVRFYVEIVTEIIKSGIYIGFGGMLLHQSTMPLHLVREILSNFKRIAVLAKDFVQHRKRMKWIEQVDIPTEQQLNEDRFCNICRDEVVSPENARMLPCAHLFHVDCLAKWLERNRDCPYCQRDVEAMINQYLAAKKRHEEGIANNNSTNNNQNPAANNNNNNDGQQNNNNNNNQNEPIVKKVRIDRRTGAIADEDILREMYEQYRTVATKRKQQEAQLTATAAALAAIASGKSKYQQQQELAQNRQQKKNNNKENDDDNNNDDSTFKIDDDDEEQEEFSLVSNNNRGTTGKTNGNNISSSSASSTELALAAYQRYERRIEKAKKKLQLELAEIKKSSTNSINNSNVNPTVIIKKEEPEAAAPAATSTSTTVKDESQQQENNNNNNTNSFLSHSLKITPSESMRKEQTDDKEKSTVVTDDETKKQEESSGNNNEKSVKEDADTNSSSSPLEVASPQHPAVITTNTTTTDDESKTPLPPLTSSLSAPAAGLNVSAMSESLNNDDNESFGKQIINSSTNDKSEKKTEAEAKKSISEPVVVQQQQQQQQQSAASSTTSTPSPSFSPTSSGFGANTGDEEVSPTELIRRRAAEKYRQRQQEEEEKKKKMQQEKDTVAKDEKKKEDEGWMSD